MQTNGVLLAGGVELIGKQEWLRHHLSLIGMNPDDITVALPHQWNAVIRDTKPRVVVALGEEAMHDLSVGGSIFDYHGYAVKSTRYPNTFIIPTHSIGFISAGNQKLTGACLYCIKKALAIAAGELPAVEYTLLEDPPMDVAGDYLMRGTHIVCDIETNESPNYAEDETQDAMWDIVRISFSTQPGTAISIPFREPYMDLIRATLAAAHSVTFWNQNFDVPRLRAAGCPINGVIHDAMWAWHFLQSDLPKKLGFAAPLLVNCSPWKHLNNALPARYSALDSAITHDCWLEIQRLLKAENRWDAFLEQCSNMLPILGGATDTGMLLDTTAQGALIDDKLTVERDALFVKLQAQVPQSVRSTKIYKKRPPKKLLDGEVFVPNSDGVGGKRILTFNPGSHVQKKALFKALGLPIPYDGRSDKESIESKHLRKYMKRFPMLGDLLAYGERQKLITSYDWKLEPDGRIHPEFGFNPSTWRKNARNPNIQTIPKRSELAKAFRALFITGPGNSLIECDSSAIEAVLVGYFGGSPRYIALAKRGVHKWLAEKLAGRPVSKEEPLYDKVKRIVHLSNYLGSSMRIAEEYPDDFSSVAEARKLQDFYFDQPEGQDVRRWQQATLAAADHDHFLQTPFGQRHYFYNVLQSHLGFVRLGSDAKRAIAFMPQATASAIQTRYLMTLPEKYRLYQPSGQFTIPCLRAIIHDSIVLEVPEAIAPDVARDLYVTMTAPIPELGGLSIGAEAKIGPNLRDMKLITF